MITIGIVGAGAMGSGIAQVAAQAGHPVIIHDTRSESLDTSKKNLASTLSKLVEKGKLDNVKSEAIASNITYTSTLAALKPSGLVIEAIVEDESIKKNLFAELSTILDQSAALATNTSSLSVTAIASAAKNPARVLGIHFFNPAPIMALVEIVPALQSDAAVIHQMTELIQSWGKTTVLAKDTPGFIVNRVARPFYGEALRMYDEGIADFATIDWAMKTIGGFRMGPFELMDMIGNDVNYAVTESVYRSTYFDSKYKPSLTQKKLVDAGWLGKKSGRGYYDYSSPLPLPNTNEETGRVIFDRIIAMLVSEAMDARYFGIATEADIELAMTKGVNYPKGLFAWSKEIGVEKIRHTMDQLYHRYREERYRGSVLLR